MTNGWVRMRDSELIATKVGLKEIIDKQKKELLENERAWIDVDNELRRRRQKCK